MVTTRKTAYTAWVIEAQQGDTAAFGKLLDCFQDMAYFTAYGYLRHRQSAQDAAQEAFFEAYRCLPKLRQPQAFPAWLQRIVFKQCDRITRGKRPLLLPLDDELGLATDRLGPDASLEQMQRAAAVRAAIKTLPEIYRQTTQLYYLHGRSTHEVAAHLEIPLSTVKKRLYDARQLLKEKLSPMNDTTYRPSQDDTFANRVTFFLALKNNDLLQVRQLARRDPELLATHTEWGVASEGWYWPLGATALHWAAGTGNEPLAALLLELGADVNAPDVNGNTPLKRAAQMGQAALVKFLLENGADPNRAANNGQTPLHAAVIRQRTAVVDLLLAHGAETAVTDSQSRTPRDWTETKNLPDLATRLGGSATQRTTTYDPRLTNLWQTGVKFIDLIAPLRWGGRNGIFTPWSGVGIDVMVGELIGRMATFGRGRSVQLVLERGGFNAQNRTWQWRNYGVDAHVELAYCDVSDSDARKRHTAETAVARVQELAADQPVLFIIDSEIVQTNDVPAILDRVSELPDVTTLYDGIETIGAEPPPLAELDTAVTFDPYRVREQLWPALDGLRSSTDVTLAAEHAAIRSDAVRLLRRFADLRYIHEAQGMAGFDLAYYGQAERDVIVRGRRLHRFLAQPLFVAEPWSATPAAFVPLAETLQTTQAILAGELDDVPEDELTAIGAWSPRWT